MKAAVVVALAAVLMSCSNEDSANSTTTVTPTTQAAAQIGVQAVVDIGGGQVLGLAIDQSAVWAVSFDNSTVAKIDPTTNEVSATVDIEGTAATALALGDEIWVGGYGPAAGTNLYRIDTASAIVTARYGVGELCCDLSFGGDSLWAIDPAGRLLSVDPITGDLLQQTPITIDRDAHTNVVYANGYVWFASDTTDLHRFDPTTGAIDAFDVGGGVPFVERDGLLWGASPHEAWAVDANGVVVERIALADSIEVLSLELSGPDVWVGIRHPGYIGAVLQVERSSGVVVQEFAVDIPARMAIGFGSLWVTDSGSSNVYRIGPIG